MKNRLTIIEEAIEKIDSILFKPMDNTLRNVFLEKRRKLLSIKMNYLKLLE